LDRRFQPDHHIICGEKVGYAAKCRQNSNCTLTINKTLTVVIYKSPAREIRPPPYAATDDYQLPENDGLKKVTVLHCPEAAAGNSYTEHTNDILDLLKRYVSHFEKDDDPLVLAQRVRLALYRSFGPIWHVYVGDEFIAESAINRRNDISLAVGKTRILCFQHEQEDPRGVDWAGFARISPFIVAALLFLLYIVRQQLCADKSSEMMLGRNRYAAFCSALSQVDGTSVIVIVVILMVVRNFTKKR